VFSSGQAQEVSRKANEGLQAARSAAGAGLRAVKRRGSFEVPSAIPVTAPPAIDPDSSSVPIKDVTDKPTENSTVKELAESIAPLRDSVTTENFANDGVESKISYEIDSMSAGGGGGGGGGGGEAKSTSSRWGKLRTGGARSQVVPSSVASSTLLGAAEALLAGKQQDKAAFVPSKSISGESVDGRSGAKRGSSINKRADDDDADGGGTVGGGPPSGTGLEDHQQESKSTTESVLSDTKSETRQKDVDIDMKVNGKENGEGLHDMEAWEYDVASLPSHVRVRLCVSSTSAASHLDSAFQVLALSLVTLSLITFKKVSLFFFPLLL